jgi:3-oxoacyl-[acyl-carrier protein] reductase
MRNVIVTGGSRGLGLGIARKLVQSGFRVIAIARKQSDEFKAAQLEAGQSHPGAMHFAPFDLADLEAIPALVKTLRKQHGALYGLVNNAGMSTDGVLALTSTQQIEQVVRLNTTSPMVLTKHAVRFMMADGSGRIVNISSITAFNGYSGLSVYAATKASLIGFTKSLAREVGRVGVTVNAVAPGFVSTEMTREMKDEDRQRIERRSALKRLVDVEDVANAVDFLLSDGARNITGTVMTVDAGNTA